MPRKAKAPVGQCPKCGSAATTYHTPKTRRCLRCNFIDHKAKFWAAAGITIPDRIYAPQPAPNVTPRTSDDEVIIPVDDPDLIVRDRPLDFEDHN